MALPPSIPLLLALIGFAACAVNVHIVPHSHDDVGWVKTIDEYYFGNNSHGSSNTDCVRCILTTVTEQLEMDPTKKFIEVEIAFFSRWWNEQTPEKQEKVRKLVEDRQLEFINGGWCMNDEATVHYQGVIDQLTLGMRWLNDTFGEHAIPRIGYHIDPFGHSATQAQIFADIGMDAFVINRIDFADKNMRIDPANKAMEFLWRPSRSLGRQTQIFTHLTYKHYSPPDHFYFDTDRTPHDQLNDANMEAKMDEFKRGILERVQSYRTDNTMLLMGEDFHYKHASGWYGKLDKMIEYFKDDPDINVFYSTPSIYFEYVHKQASDEKTLGEWPLKTGDFFPYGELRDTNTPYWTGYFVSRPALKGYEREGNAYLQACRQLDFVDAYTPRNDTLGDVHAMEDAMGVLQHHDGVSGTEKQFVADDYTRFLDNGRWQCSQRINQVIGAMTRDRDSPKRNESCDCPYMFQQCPLANISVCEATEALSESAIIIYNPLAQRRISHIRVPVPNDRIQVWGAGKGTLSSIAPSTAVYDMADQPNQQPFVLDFAAELPPLGYATYFLRDPEAQGILEGGGGGDMSPTGAKATDQQIKQAALRSPYAGLFPHMEDDHYQCSEMSYGTGEGTNAKHRGESSHRKLLCGLPSGDEPNSEESLLGPDPYRSFTMENRMTRADFLRGSLQHMCMKDAKVEDPPSMVVTQSFYAYSSWEGDHQKSGAYIFRPQEGRDDALIKFEPEIVRINLDAASGVQEVEQKFCEAGSNRQKCYISQTIRLYSEAPYFEFEHTIGPIPPDGLGREIITRFDLSGDVSFIPWQTNKTVFTDENCREMQKRVLDERDTYTFEGTEPVAQNYYPMNCAAYINSPQGWQFTVLTDRSRGVASLRDGSIEVMVHRRTEKDDGRGVGEALQEPGRFGHGLVTRGKHWILVNSDKEVARQLQRGLQDELNTPPVVLFRNLSSMGADLYYETHHMEWSAGELPTNVHLVTLKQLDEARLLVRVAHRFEVDESANYSLPVSFSLREFLAPGLMDMRGMLNVQELGLAGNAPRRTLVDRRLQFDDVVELPEILEPSKPDFMVHLKPMEIRTFEVTLTTVEQAANTNTGVVAGVNLALVVVIVLVVVACCGLSIGFRHKLCPGLLERALRSGGGNYEAVDLERAELAPMEIGR